MLSHVELSKKNLVHNLKSLKKLSGSKLAFAVKGNAYGHGLFEIVEIANAHVDYFLVNSIDELRMVRAISKKKVLLLGYVDTEDLPEAIELGCILGVFSFEQLKNINEVSKGTQEVHVALDAHLGREGVLEHELPSFLKEAVFLKHVRIAGMYAHFANIEDTKDLSHAKKQKESYERMLEVAKTFGYKKLLTHISATSGVLASMGKDSIARVGIGGYGLWPSEHLKKKGLSLKPVLSWKTKVAQVKTLPKGRSISYGLTYITKKETNVALIPQGYADGFPRSLSNKGCVIIRGSKCPVLGRVCMNMFVVDVSGVSKVSEGDEVVIIGKGVTAEDVGRLSGTINYEVTTRISPLLPRIVFF